MIDLIRLVLPYLLLLYFVVKGIKKPYYFLGIPFLMFMSQSVFFEGVKLFRIPGRFFYTLIFIWLGFLWIFSMVIERFGRRNKIRSTHVLNVLDFCNMGLIIISFIGLATTILNYPILTGVFQEFAILISLFACYFIIMNWTSQNDPEVLLNFLFSLVIVNSIAAILYILHQGLHIRIYQAEEYLTAVFNGEEITRTFWFMPQFPFLAIAFCLVFRNKRPIVLTVLLIINLLAVFITYFRSFSVTTVILFILYFLLVGLKKGKLGLAFRNVIISAVVGILFFIALLKVFPSNTKYFLERFSEITTPQLAKAPNNMDVRFANTGMVISNIDDDKIFLGMGSVTENQTIWTRSMKEATADMVWCGVIYRWGFLGLLLFILLYIYSGIRAISIFIKSEGVISELGLLFLLIIISQIFESFIDWTFMSGHGFAIGLWYFAMLSALLGFEKQIKFSSDRLLKI